MFSTFTARVLCDLHSHSPSTITFILAWEELPEEAACLEPIAACPGSPWAGESFPALAICPLNKRSWISEILYADWRLCMQTVRERVLVLGQLCAIPALPWGICLSTGCWCVLLPQKCFLTRGRMEPGASPVIVHTEQTQSSAVPMDQQHIWLQPPVGTYQWRTLASSVPGSLEQRVYASSIMANSGFRVRWSWFLCIFDKMSRRVSPYILQNSPKPVKTCT